MGMNALTVDSARVRAGSWRGSDDLAYLVPLSGASTLTPSTLERIRAHLRGDGFRSVVTAAVGPSERDMLAADGFTEHEPFISCATTCRSAARTPAPGPRAPPRSPPRRSMRSSTSTGRPSRRSGNSTATGCTGDQRHARHPSSCRSRPRRRRLRGHRPGRHPGLPPALGRAPRPAGARTRD